MSPAQPLFHSLMAESAESAPLAGGACGPDLEYAPAFLDFMASAQGRQEQQLGDSVIPAQDPDWRAVLKSGMALARETRDLRIAAILTHAATEIHGLRGLADGLALIRDWLCAYWETLHPVLEIDGERDPLMRSNALSYLYAPNACLKAVRQARLVESRAGDLSVGDAESILKSRPVPEAALVNSPEQLTRLVADEYERNQDTFAALRQAATWQQDIAAIWKSKLDAEYWPEFDALGELLERLALLVDGPASHPPVDNAAAVPTQHPPSTPVPDTSTAPTLPDAIHNRRDAFRTLALARQYFERHEPSHPAPLLIQRIEKLEALNFAQIISELAPDALTQLKQVAGDQLSL